jgi:L-ascorbate metabolism protein UlaG (beta-lactamase superfamily)
VSAAAKTLSITWLGHATFLFVSPGGRRLVLDPWLTDNPACPPHLKRIERADIVLVTHGHRDHMGDAAAVARATGATVVANPEICQWLESKGLQQLSPMNIGGSQQLGAIRIVMVPAVHSSSFPSDHGPIYMGDAAGYVLTFENGLVMYCAGDTGLFGDMRLIGELHRPDIAVLPIGDRFTMGPEAAARACEWLGVRQVVPMHYGTFPILTGTPSRLRELVAPLGIEVLELVPGRIAQ